MMRCDTPFFSTVPPTPSPFLWLYPDALPLGEAEPRGTFFNNQEEGQIVDTGEDSGLSDFGDGPLVPQKRTAVVSTVTIVFLVHILFRSVVRMMRVTRRQLVSGGGWNPSTAHLPC